MMNFSRHAKTFVFLFIAVLLVQGCAQTTARKKAAAQRMPNAGQDMTFRTTEAILKGTEHP